MSKTWRTVRVLVELPVRGGTNRAIVNEVRQALDDRLKTTTVEFLERGKYRVKDFQMVKRHLK